MDIPTNKIPATSTFPVRVGREGGKQTMKLSFILKNNGRIVRGVDDIAPLNRATFARRLCESVETAVQNVDCPADKEASFIEIEMNISELTFSWKISDACCKSFYDLMHPIVLAAIIRQTHPTSRS